MRAGAETAARIRTTSAASSSGRSIAATTFGWNRTCANSARRAAASKPSVAAISSMNARTSGALREIRRRGRCGAMAAMQRRQHHAATAITRSMHAQIVHARSGCAGIDRVRRMVSSLASRLDVAPFASFAVACSIPVRAPFLFALDPGDRARRSRSPASIGPPRLGVAQLVAPRVRASPVDGDGTHLSQSRRTGRRSRQERGAHRRTRDASASAFIECGTVTPRPQPGNPKPRMFRLLAGAGADQSPGLQQRRRRTLPRQRRASPLRDRARRHPRAQHRQEFRHAERARGRRLRHLPARRLCARELRHRQHLVAEHARACATCRPTLRSRQLLGTLKGEQAKLGADSTASTRRSWSRSRRT